MKGIQLKENYKKTVIPFNFFEVVYFHCFQFLNHLHRTDFLLMIKHSNFIDIWNFRQEKGQLKSMIFVWITCVLLNSTT